MIQFIPEFLEAAASQIALFEREALEGGGRVRDELLELRRGDGGHGEVEGRDLRVGIE